KKLIATRGEGRPVSVLTATNVTEEADAVAALVKTAIDEGRHRPNAIAILLRANAHLHNFARALQRHGVPYQVSGGRGFYQQPEIKDCLAYLRAVEGPDDTVCLMRLLSLPRYAADSVQAGRWARQARDDGRRFFDLLQESSDDGARRLTEDLRRFNGLALRLGVDDLFYEVMEQTHYLDLERFLGPIELLKEELPAAELHLAEERRLAYVALTRAREEIVCTLASRYEGIRDWRPSRFLTPIRGEGARELAASQLLAASGGVVEVARQVELPLNDAPPIAALSYTQPDTYLRC